MAYRVYYNSPSGSPQDFENLEGVGGAFGSFIFDLAGQLPITDVEVEDLEALDGRKVHAWDDTASPAAGHVVITTGPTGEAHGLTSDASIKDKVEFFLTAEW